ncbi:MAG: hypothetical protein NW223_14970 [Hyphomicrobiaceae bacterium]|nr:hypothetical protein [Hyphomicrobiaceae bacterium]
MGLRLHHWGELIGILLLLASTATQIFYVDPLKREIEWRLASFSMQQNSQIQTRAIFDTRIATLRALKAPDEDVRAAAAERDAVIARYATADANISDYILAKQPVEDWLQIIVVALFAAGTFLAGISRAIEMIASRRPP